MNTQSMKNKKENLNLPDIYKLTEEERNEARILFKELIKMSLTEKRKYYIGIPEHIIYNFLRGAPLFKGINNVKDSNRAIYGQWGLHYGLTWEYLATHSQAKEVHQKFSRIIGYKYEPILKTIRQEFFNKM